MPFLVFGKKPEEKLPIVYSPEYNLGFKLMQRLHPFDLAKYGNVFKSLVSKRLIREKDVVQPKKIGQKDLSAVHSTEYLDRFKKPSFWAHITEVPQLAKIPMLLLHRLIVNPMLRQASGSILAGELALKHGWAINLGGGFHHASRDNGEGFCAIADITLSIENLRHKHPEIKRVLIVDLDAHQGNGHERDFLKDKDVMTVDFYTDNIYPDDDLAKTKIDIAEPLKPDTPDAEYLGKLSSAFNKVAAADFKPDVVYYVAGMDILEGDRLGMQSVTAGGVIQRDEMVFDYALRNKVPLVMLFGGGYQKSNAAIISDSIENLHKKFGLLNRPAAPRI